jgi:hypothetical protein
MSERVIQDGNHEYKVVSIALTDGGWTTAIIHIDHGSHPPNETRLDSNLEHPTDEEALAAGEMVVTDMCRRRNN